MLSQASKRSRLASNRSRDRTACTGPQQAPLTPLAAPPAHVPAHLLGAVHHRRQQKGNLNFQRMFLGVSLRATRQQRRCRKALFGLARSTTLLHPPSRLGETAAWPGRGRPGSGSAPPNSPARCSSAGQVRGHGADNAAPATDRRACAHENNKSLRLASSCAQDWPTKNSTGCVQTCSCSPININAPEMGRCV